MERRRSVGGNGREKERRVRGERREAGRERREGEEVSPPGVGTRVRSERAVASQCHEV